MSADMMSDTQANLSLSPALSANIEARVSAYLKRLGLQDPALTRQLAEECLERARRRAAPGSESELLRRSLEEAQRRFNQALSTALGINKVEDDERPLAAARAAFLLRGQALPADELFRDPVHAQEWAGAVSSALPNATPPESPLEMHAHPLRFWLFKS